MTKKAFSLLALGLGVVLVVLSGGLRGSPPAQKMDRLIVYGNGFMFGVKEPDGWHGDTEGAARFQANILFYPAGRALGRDDPLIRVGIYDKKDENTAADLEADMTSYRKAHPDVRFEDLDAPHPQYATYPKLFAAQGRFYEYVVYVNPGKGFQYLFSVALSTGKRPATEAELEAFRTVTGSLLAMGEKQSAAPKVTDFDEALKAAETNLDSKKGKKYDIAFARKAAPWLVNKLAACTKGRPPQDLKPVTVLVRVSEAGKPEEVLVRPETKVALCLRPSFLAARCPKPPGPSWWVKMEITIAP
jgi:hypothetical protein